MDPTSPDVGPVWMLAILAGVLVALLAGVRGVVRRRRHLQELRENAARLQRLHQIAVVDYRTYTKGQR